MIIYCLILLPEAINHLYMRKTQITGVSASCLIANVCYSGDLLWLLLTLVTSLLYKASFKDCGSGASVDGFRQDGGRLLVAL